MDLPFVAPLNDAQFAAQSASYTGTAGTCTGWPTGPQGVLVWSDQACYIRVGTSVTATTADTVVPANTMVAFAIPPTSKSLWTVSAIQLSAGGTVYAKPINKQ